MSDKIIVTNKIKEMYKSMEESRNRDRKNRSCIKIIQEPYQEICNKSIMLEFYDDERKFNKDYTRVIYPILTGETQDKEIGWKIIRQKNLRRDTDSMFLFNKKSNRDENLYSFEITLEINRKDLKEFTDLIEPIKQDIFEESGIIVYEKSEQKEDKQEIFEEFMEMGLKKQAKNGSKTKIDFFNCLSFVIEIRDSSLEEIEDTEYLRSLLKRMDYYINTQIVPSIVYIPEHPVLKKKKENLITLSSFNNKITYLKREPVGFGRRVIRIEYDK